MLGIEFITCRGCLAQSLDSLLSVDDSLWTGTAADPARHSAGAACVRVRAAGDELVRSMTSG
eukprot:scaffold330165_cov39-Prasinocladus_malaysianus.AAC.1